MIELVLIIVFLAILIGGQLLITRVRKPLVYYIKICSALGLLVLVWLPGDAGSSPAVKVIISAIALTSLYTGFASLKKFTSVIRSQQLDEKN
jgi:uncharacterized membrane protein YjjB (DUF3815 family)